MLKLYFIRLDVLCCWLIVEGRLWAVITEPPLLVIVYAAITGAQC